MKTAHFVYVLPYEVSIFHKFCRRFFYIEPFRRSSVESYMWPTPLRAPQSITFHVGKYLEGKFNIKLYDWRERGRINSKPGDILIGHLCPDRNTVMWNSLGDKNFSKIYLIQPYNNDSQQMSWAEDAVKLCDQFFAIAGDFWAEQFNATPFSQLRDKIHFLNMAVDSFSYPFIKNNFNPPGRRKFFYIGRYGRYGDEKGIKLLEKLAECLPEFEGGYICDGPQIKGWKKICNPTLLTPDITEAIAKEFDVFINMSRADAQATTVLEAMSWGFPVACTNQSGYSRDDKLFYLSLDDMSHNVSLIREIQCLPDQQLKAIALCNRKVCQEKYSWQKFISSLDELIKEI